MPHEVIGTKRPSDVFVINKIDRLAASEQAAMREGIKDRTDTVMTSMTEGSGLQALETLIADRAEALTRVNLHFPPESDMLRRFRLRISVS